MREILFRGKEDGCFYCGNLITTVSKEKLIAVIQEHDTLLHTKHLVDVKTVGQYTGLTDKNGAKIFEGDVLNFRGDIGYVVFSGGSFSAINDDSTVNIRPHEFSFCEVNGNIHDNNIGVTLNF